MATRRELLEKRAGAAEAVMDMYASKKDGDEWSAEERTKFDRAADEISELDAEIRKLDDEGRDALGKELTESGKVREIDLSTKRTSIVENGNGETRDGDVHPTATKEYGQAFRSYVRHGMSGMEREQQAQLQGRQWSEGELRAQGVASGAVGGYFVPQGFRQEIIETLKYFSQLRPIADTITTDTGNPLPWPKNDDTGNVGAILAENTTISQQDVVIGTAQLGAYMYTSKAVLVSYQLLQDSAFSIDSFLARKFGQRLGRIQNQHFTVGTGTGQPLGVATSPTTGKTGLTGQTTSAIYDDFIDLVHSIDPAYRQGGEPRWMMHDLTLAKARKIKDTQGRPLWQPNLGAAGMVEGAPDMLFGYPYTINNDMPVMAANALSILFGDFKAYYVIRDVLGVQMVRLTERYADALQVGFFAYQRTDATVQDANAVKAYANSAT